MPGHLMVRRFPKMAGAARGEPPRGKRKSIPVEVEKPKDHGQKNECIEVGGNE